MAPNQNAQEQEPIPKDIPWKLAATTLALRPAGDPPLTPSGSSVALLTYVPNLQSLDKDYPDDRLVYLRFLVTISPDAHTPEGAAELKPLLAEGLPVWTSVVDIRISPEPDPESGFRPYTLSAAPIRRTMLETGIVGDERFEGEASGLAVGKSGATLAESFHSGVETTAARGGTGLIPSLIWGWAKGTTETIVDGWRNVTQSADVTQREASKERRETLSHVTHVENVLTLLTAKHIGSPYLQFTLRPRPIRVLTVDPADPNLWYDQFLRRHSSGIEGIQDFFAIAVVPRKTPDFCVSIVLRNVYVFDDPPCPPSTTSEFTLQDVNRVLDYLYERYPAGTPVDELDVDVFSTDSHWLIDEHPSVLATKARSWAIHDWELGNDRLNLAHILGPNGNSPSEWFSGGAASALITGARLGVPGAYVKWVEAVYKTIPELKLEMERYKYLQDLLRSPLERGVVFYVAHTLRVCFRFAADGSLSITSTDAATQSPSVLGRPTLCPQAGNLPIYASGFQHYSRDLAIKSTLAWNHLERALTVDLSSRTNWPKSPLRYDLPDVAHVLLRRMEKLSPNDPLNKSLEGAASYLGLTQKQIRNLKSAGITDLRTLAIAVNSAPASERLKRRFTEQAKRLAKDAELIRKTHPTEAVMLPKMLKLPVSHLPVAAANLIGGKVSRTVEAQLESLRALLQKRPRKQRKKLPAKKRAR